MAYKKGTLRVFSRHPSHGAIRNNIDTGDKKILYRLGSTTVKPSIANYTELNTVESIQNCSNKLKMKKIFRENNINSPVFYDLDHQKAGIYTEEGYRFISYENLADKIKYPVLAKKSFRSRGQGMKKLDNAEELLEFINDKIKGTVRENLYYLEQFHNYIKEYRLHIDTINEECFYSCRKMLKQEFADSDKNWFRNDSNSVWIREYENGEDRAIFDKPETWNDIVAECIKATKALGLSIGAADVKVTKSGKFKILEINSAPSFGDVTTKKYINQLKKIMANV
jgi:D-alanine-D-alanine ligase-like ATP-grasp enzyme